MVIPFSTPTSATRRPLWRSTLGKLERMCWRTCQRWPATGTWRKTGPWGEDKNSDRGGIAGSPWVTDKLWKAWSRKLRTSSAACPAKSCKCCMFRLFRSLKASQKLVAKRPMRATARTCTWKMARPVSTGSCPKDSPEIPWHKEPKVSWPEYSSMVLVQEPAGQSSWLNSSFDTMPA